MLGGSTLPWWVFLYPLVTIALLIGVTLIAKRRPGRGRRTALVVNFSVTAIYLVWRAFFTLPIGDPLGLVVGIILLVTEALGAFSTFLFAISLWSPVKPHRVPLPRTGPFPSVDIFIATYNEPAAMLKPTLAAAAAVRYPGTVTVYLCDDGRRPEFQALAERYGAIHLTRPDNAHAKAGNLNHALTRSSGELIVTLDADMVPRENFLEESVGLFIEDPTLGLAQAPQAFYNEDPFQYNLYAGVRLPNEQDFFMRELQGGYERFNATMYVGSNAIIRRTALEEIGGFVTGGLTEDFATGLQLQSRGIRIAYIGEIIAAGLAAEDVADLLTQRDRWCRGAIQCAQAWSPFTMRGLSAIQRMIYLNRILYWYFGVFKAIYLYTPLLFLLFGIPALVTDVWHLAVFWLPYYIASFTAFRILSGGRRSFTWSHIYELAMGPALAVSALSETIGLGSTRFAVTPKGVTSDRQVMYWKLALPHLLYLALAVIGLLNVFWWNRDSFPLEASLIPAAWTVYNIVGTVIAALIFLQRPRHRTGERTRVKLPAEILPIERVDAQPIPVTIDDLSFLGARIHMRAEALRQGFPEGILLTLPDPSGTLHPKHGSPSMTSEPSLQVRCEVVWSSEIPREQTTVSADDAAQAGLGLRFVETTAAAEIRIMQLITESAGWVRHDYETKAHLVGLTRDLSSGLSTPPTRHRRQDLRFAATSPEEVTLHLATSGSGVPAEIVDLSASGVQIRLGSSDATLLEPGAIIAFGTGEVDATTSFSGHGRVQWRREVGSAVHAGLAFVAASDDHVGGDER